MSPAAAWYEDPLDPTQERWFDGTEWTVRERDKGGVEQGVGLGDEVHVDEETKVVAAENGESDEPVAELKDIHYGKPKAGKPAKAGLKVKKRLLVGGIIAAVLVGAVAGSFPLMDAMGIDLGAPTASAPPAESLAPVDSDGVVEDALVGVPNMPLLDAAQEIADDASDVFYDDCAAAIAADAAPISIGMPGYSIELDEDGNGVACD